MAEIFVLQIVRKKNTVGKRIRNFVGIALVLCKYQNVGFDGFAVGMIGLNHSWQATGFGIGKEGDWYFGVFLEMQPASWRFFEAKEPYRVGKTRPRWQFKNADAR